MGKGLRINAAKRETFLDKVRQELPEGGNVNLCLTCGACGSGYPATRLLDMDPCKFLRMAAMGMDDTFTVHKWVWLCSMCMRCSYVCPMEINIAGLIMEGRRLLWPREDRPTGTPPDDFRFVVEDALEEVRQTQPGWENLQAPIDKQGATFFLSQNSREPASLPKELSLCGRSSTSPVPTGPMAAPPGPAKIIACSSPMTMAGSSLPKLR